ncbi:MAG TPA: Spy/CpxP family protein refolding chaperone [Longimicrobiaceae bacterium]|jgi:hypothetical protein|nr:Spy/CpxP family protein refolding chaperone [Longimicrobiaceae bacterium]
MKIRSFALGLALVGAPLSLHAQQASAPAQGREAHGQHARGGRGEGQQGPRQSPIQRLIANRQQLSLTDAQVQRLQGIEQGLQSRNQPIMERMRAMRQQAGLPERGQGGAQGQRPQLTEQQRAALKQSREQMRPLMKQMRDNNKAAMEQVKSVLTSAQKDQVKALHRQERGNREGHGHRGGQRNPAQATPQQRS